MEAFNKVDDKVSKTVYGTDSQEDWQKWKDGGRSHAGGLGAANKARRAISSRALPAFPLLGQWDASEKSEKRKHSQSESNWSVEEQWDDKKRKESGHGDTGRYTAFDGKRKRMEEMKAKPVRTKPGPAISDVASGKQDGEIPGVTCAPQAQSQFNEDGSERYNEDGSVKEENEEINELYKQHDATSYKALEQVSLAMNRAGTTAANQMLGSGRSDPKESTDVWAKAVDSNTGRAYFYHKQTGETKWELAELAGVVVSSGQTYSKASVAKKVCRVWMGITRGGEPIGRIVVKLDYANAPKTSENFRQVNSVLCRDWPWLLVPCSSTVVAFSLRSHRVLTAASDR
jgi:hypothetical protein